jgi:hypothetical protein
MSQNPAVPALGGGGDPPSDATPELAIIGGGSAGIPNTGDVTETVSKDNVTAPLPPSAFPLAGNEARVLDGLAAAASMSSSVCDDGAVAVALSACFRDDATGETMEEGCRRGAGNGAVGPAGARHGSTGRLVGTDEAADA